MAKNKSRKPALVKEPTPTKRPHFPSWFGPTTLEGKHIAWRFGHADNSGTWPWSSAKGDVLEEIITKLGQFESMDYAYGLKDIRSLHYVSTIIKDAQKRLQELQRDDIERLYAWHIQGRGRVWCAEYDGLMCVLWWDDRHEVYPTPKKGT